MNLPTQSQTNAALRYAGTTVGSAASILVLLGLIDANTSTQLIAAFHKFFDDLQALIGDVYVIVGIAGPIVIVWLGKIGYNSASPKNQVAAALAADPKTMIDAVNASNPKIIIAAAQAIPAAQVNVTDPQLAAGIPGVKVVSS